MICSIMKIPNGFKIRKKADCDTFINDCMCKGESYSIVYEEGKQLLLEKDKEGNVFVAMRWGDLNDIFNPSLEVARTKDNCYNKSVQDYVWQFRKAINKEWFNEKKEW